MNLELKQKLKKLNNKYDINDVLIDKKLGRLWVKEWLSLLVEDLKKNKK
jgi:hypothetical protein